MNNTCFVIMPIGTQVIGNKTITEDELRTNYDYIIKNAISKADPTLKVIRADEELNSASMSNDIFYKLMHSKYVIADITYPNPNVFYELGIRHAIKPGTILIREKLDFNVPFDISHLRYIEYSKEPSGMEKLSAQLKRRFEFYNANPNKPDNQFLELCSFTNYTPTIYSEDTSQKEDVIAELLSIIFENPNLINLLTDSSLSNTDQQKIFLQELSKNPQNSKQLFKSLIKSGMFKF